MSISALDVLETLLAPAKRPKSEAAARRDALEGVRAGLPAAVIDRLAQHFQTTKMEVQNLLGLSRATAQRRRKRQDVPLDPVNSDRALRLATVFSLARSVFEDERNAAEWFKEPNRALQGERPFDLLDTELGTRQVVQLLNRIEHGVYS